MGRSCAFYSLDLLLDRSLWSKKQDSPLCYGNLTRLTALKLDGLTLQSIRGASLDALFQEPERRKFLDMSFLVSAQVTMAGPEKEDSFFFELSPWRVFIFEKSLTPTQEKFLKQLEKKLSRKRPPLEDDLEGSLKVLMNFLESPAVSIPFHHLRLTRQKPLIASLISLGALRRQKTAPFMVCFECPYPHLADVLTTPQGNLIQACCPLKTFDASPETLRAYEINDAWLLANLQKAFRVQKYPPQALYQNKIWRLGQFNVGKRFYMLYFARNLSDMVVFEHVKEILKTPHEFPPFFVTSCTDPELLRRALLYGPTYKMADVLGLSVQGLTLRQKKLAPEISHAYKYQNLSVPIQS